MPTRPIDRLLFAQGGLCFFCQHTLSPADASVEHMVAVANGGGNDPDNTVACCKALNSVLGHMSLKEKLRVVLNQKGQFKCPNGGDALVKPTGHETAAQLLLTAGDNVQRLRSEASFAALCGVSPVPASSGKTTRHRLSRGGDRAANSALHIIAIGRLRTDPRTQAYVAKRITEKAYPVGSGHPHMWCEACKRVLARPLDMVGT